MTLLSSTTVLTAVARRRPKASEKNILSLFCDADDRGDIVVSVARMGSRTRTT
jgi:hypothetical protein